MGSKVALSSKDMNSQKIVNLLAGTADTDAVNKSQMDTGDTSAKSRANHTGTQTASTISDFDAQVRTSRLDQMTAPAGTVSWNSQRLSTLGDPTGAQDAATKNYVDAQVAAISGGLVFKGAARAVATANVSVTAAPSTIDGVTPTTGDVFLLTAQTTGTENGPWVWTGAGSAMTRPSNWDTTAEAVPGSLWVVRQGTYDNQLAILSNDTFTLGTSVGTFVFVNPAAASDNDSSFAMNAPATSAGQAWAVNHNLGTKDVHVSVFRTASPFDEVDVLITRDTTSQVNIRPDVAITAGEFRVIVSKVI